MILSKDELRKVMHKKRDSLSKDEVISLSNKILEKFLKSNFTNYQHYMVYMSMHNEADTKELMKYLFSKDKQVYVPWINKENKLVPLKVTKDTIYEKDAFGIDIPIDKILVDPKIIEFIFVPGLAFDKKGHRVGYGKGYYDGFLKGLDSKTCAWAYDFQMVDDITDIHTNDVAIKYYL